MTTFMLPPVNDEPAPRQIWIATLCILLLVGIIAALTTLGRLDPIPEKLFNTSAVILFPETLQGMERALKERRMDDAFPVAMAHALTGEPQAQYRMGLLLATGLDNTYRRDFCAAAPWFYKAAQTKHASAQLMLAAMYFAGEGVRRNKEYGFYWYRSGIASAQQSGENLENRILRVRRVMESHFPELNSDSNDYDPDQDVARAPPLAQSAPPLSTQSIPEIPMLGPLYGALVLQSTGCHNKTDFGLHEVFYGTAGTQ